MEIQSGFRLSGEVGPNHQWHCGEAGPRKSRSGEARGGHRPARPWTGAANLQEQRSAGRLPRVGCHVTGRRRALELLESDDPIDCRVTQ
eukprot:755579-Hanusia_phi.AAC.2